MTLLLSLTLNYNSLLSLGSYLLFPALPCCEECAGPTSVVKSSSCMTGSIVISRSRKVQFLVLGSHDYYGCPGAEVLSLREQKNKSLWGITYRADLGDRLDLLSKKNEWEKQNVQRRMMIKISHLPITMVAHPQSHLSFH